MIFQQTIKAMQNNQSQNLDLKVIQTQIALTSAALLKKQAKGTTKVFTKILNDPGKLYDAITYLNHFPTASASDLHDYFISIFGLEYSKLGNEHPMYRIWLSLVKTIAAEAGIDETTVSTEQEAEDQKPVLDEYVPAGLSEMAEDHPTRLALEQLCRVAPLLSEGVQGLLVQISAALQGQGEALVFDTAASIVEKAADGGFGKDELEQVMQNKVDENDLDNGHGPEAETNDPIMDVEFETGDEADSENSQPNPEPEQVPAPKPTGRKKKSEAKTDKQ